MLEAIFAPQSIASVGASPDPSKLGRRVLRNVIENSYPGRVLPIHLPTPVILDRPACSSIRVVPDAIGLAAIVMPSQAVPPVMDECAEIAPCLDHHQAEGGGAYEGAIVMVARIVLQG